MTDPVCGIEYETISEIEKDCYQVFNSQQFAFVALPLSENNEDLSFEPLEMYHYDFDWGNKVIGMIPDVINVDSSDCSIRKKSEILLKKNFKLACYTGVNTVMVNLKNQDNTNLARLCAYHLHDSHGKPMWFRITVDEKSENAWNTWNTFLSNLPENQNKVGVVLELGETAPTDLEMKRWQAEVLLGLSISTERFIPNKEKYPVLRREFQEVVKRAFEHKAQIIIHGQDNHNWGVDAYQKYIYHLYETREPMSVYNDFSMGYEELLQIPLQPLKDNLDNATYEVALGLKIFSCLTKQLLFTMSNILYISLKLKMLKVVMKVIFRYLRKIRSSTSSTKRLFIKYYLTEVYQVLINYNK